MPGIPLHVIPKPPEGTRAVFVADVLPVLYGDGDTNFYCGLCGTVLAQNVIRDLIPNIVIRCPVCVSFNDTLQAY